MSRWVKEVIRLLSAKAERLHRVLKKIARKGGSVVLLDGTLIRTQRRAGAQMQRRYSGKHKCHGLLFIALTDAKGRLLWTATAKPGRASDITTCRHNHLAERLQEAGLGAIADLDFVGLDKDPENPAIVTGYKATKNKPLTRAKKEVNKLIASERAVWEHAFAHLKSWRILTKLRFEVRYATALVRALMILISARSPVDGRSWGRTCRANHREHPDRDAHHPHDLPIQGVHNSIGTS